MFIPKKKYMVLLILFGMQTTKRQRAILVQNSGIAVKMILGIPASYIVVPVFSPSSALDSNILLMHTWGQRDD